MKIMGEEELELPDLIHFDDFDGDYERYIERVYEIFAQDFIQNRLYFRRLPVRFKRLPEFQNRSCTFYHITHTGSDEQNRTPDLRRCERIGWVRPVIEQCDNWNLKVWEQLRKGKIRICIWLDLEGEPDLVVILDKRSDCVLLWTVFTLTYEHEKRKKLREYQEWIRENT